MGNIVSVMVTGAGAPGTAGTVSALRNNPGKINYRITAIDMKDDCIGKYIADAFYPVPDPGHPDYIPKLKDIIQRERIKVIIPQTTREVEVISGYAEFFQDLGTKIIASDHKCVAEANNKITLISLSKEIGVPYPKFVLTGSEKDFIQAVGDLGYPDERVVIKPPVSNGSRGVRILSPDAWSVRKFLDEKPDGMEVDLENVLRMLRNGKWPALLVTEYLSGAEYTVDVFRNGAGVVVIPRLRETIRSGITFNASVDYREDIIEYSKRLSVACGLFYCFGFQFKLSKEGVPKILECNPRVQGTMAFSSFAGFNMVHHSVQEALGCPVSLDSIKLKDKIQFKRYWGGMAIDNGHCIGSI